jgi:hypothetical protein
LLSRCLSSPAHLSVFSEGLVTLENYWMVGRLGIGLYKLVTPKAFARLRDTTRAATLPRNAGLNLVDDTVNSFIFARSCVSGGFSH